MECYVAISYSFDSNMPLYRFDSEQEAAQFIRKDFLEEIRIEQEENNREIGVDLYVNINKEGTFAQIKSFTRDGEEDIMEWNLAYEERTPPKPDVQIPQYTLYLYDKDGDVYTEFKSSEDLEELIDLGRDLRSAIESGTFVRGENQEPYDWSEIRDQFDNRYWISTIDM